MVFALDAIMNFPPKIQLSDWYGAIRLGMPSKGFFTNLSNPDAFNS